MHITKKPSPHNLQKYL